jgi:hypothetical protein
MKGISRSPALVERCVPPSGAKIRTTPEGSKFERAAKHATELTGEGLSYPPGGPSLGEALRGTPCL